MDKLVAEFKAFRRLLRRRTLISRAREATITEQVHQLYFGAAGADLSWGATYWLGVKVMKCPLDLWIYQEILFERRITT